VTAQLFARTYHSLYTTPNRVKLSASLPLLHHLQSFNLFLPPWPQSVHWRIYLTSATRVTRISKLTGTLLVLLNLCRQCDTRLVPLDQYSFTRCSSVVPGRILVYSSLVTSPRRRNARLLVTCHFSKEKRLFARYSPLPLLGSIVYSLSCVTALP
jgi:hypothetical protein